jgi:hypothetical protein
MTTGFLKSDGDKAFRKSRSRGAVTAESEEDTSEKCTKDQSFPNDPDEAERSKFMSLQLPR